MALVQVSLSGGRVTGGNHIAYSLTGTGGAQSDAPTLGANITSWTGGAGQPATPSTTGATSFLCVESHSKPHPTLKGAWAVWATFDALRTVTISGLSLPTGWFAIEVSPGISGDMRRGVGKNVLLDVPSTADNKTVESNIPYRSVYPGESGMFAPYMQRYGIRGASRPTRNEVTLYYDPPTVEEVLWYNSGYVLVEARSIPAVTQRQYDRNGKWVWHIENDEAGNPLYKWEPVRGSSAAFEQRIQFRTRFAKNYAMGGNLNSYYNTVNSAIMAQYWYCPAGTLRFTAWTKYRAPTVAKLWLYDCLIEYNPTGWNEETEVQKYKYQIWEVEHLDVDGVSFTTKKYKPIGDWVPTGATYYAEFCNPAQWPMILGKYDW